MRDWVRDRLKAVFNRGVENALWLGLGFAVFAAWKWASGDVTFPLWLLFLFIGIPLALAVATRRMGRRPAAEAAVRIAELEHQNALYGYYATMLSDVLRTIQQKVRGDLDFTLDAMIEQGILEPAREFLRQGPGEDVRLSVLVPESDGQFSMKWMAGHRLASKHAFKLPVAGSFSQLALQSGKIEWSFDVDQDHRFTLHPKAKTERAYCTIVSVPLRAGGEVVAVLNVVSTFSFAFTLADFVFISLIGAIVDVVWSMEEREKRASEAVAVERRDDRADD